MKVREGSGPDFQDLQKQNAMIDIFGVKQNMPALDNRLTRWI